MEKTKKELVEVGLVPEDYGGDTVTVEVSAKTKKGLDQLLEMILLVAEMEELKADPTAPFEGVVIESKLDARRGPVATVLVKNGTLRIGDEIFAGETNGKVKAMIDDRGQRIQKAGPSTPMEVLGLDGVPEVGSVMSSEKTVVATLVVASKNGRGQATQLQKDERVLNIVLKSDVEGTLEAIRSAIEQPISEGKDSIRFIHAATGDINESDVLLAQASGAVILGFNVRIPLDVKHLAKTIGVEVRTYNIIYELLEDAEKILHGLLEKKEEKGVRGEGEIIKLFTLPKSGDVICGTRLDYGQVKTGDRIKVSRNGEVVHSGRVKSLHVETEEKKKVAAGVSVGILIKPQFEFKVGDQLAVP